MERCMYLPDGRRGFFANTVSPSVSADMDKKAYQDAAALIDKIGQLMKRMQRRKEFPDYAAS